MDGSHSKDNLEPEGNRRFVKQYSRAFQSASFLNKKA